MAVWLVRAGRRGEREDFALDNGVAVIGWEAIPDLSQVETRGQVEELVRTAYDEPNARRVRSQVGQLWTFVKRINEGDLIVLPLKRQAAIAIGRATGPYQYRPDFPTDARHSRPVEWLVKDLPRTALDQDLLYSLGSLLTVCRIERGNAEERIAKLVGQQRPPTTAAPAPASDEPSDSEGPPEDLEGYAEDQIRVFIGQHFRGHEFAALIDALLQAQGYVTELSPAGPDGGIDIIAGQGAMGFDPPRLCVQVKSSDSPVDVRVLRELQGAMHGFGGNQGLLVSWGGYKQSVWTEARRRFFEIRLWDAGDVVKQILHNYEHLPDALRAELPLKRIWTLVPDEER